MSVWRRLGNVARGKVLSWQRGSDAAAEEALEEDLRQPRAPRAVEEPAEPVSRAVEEPVEGTPARPRKRRL